MYQVYEYNGPVLEFGRCIADNWKGTTRAESERKAKSNLTYQFKKHMGKLQGTKIELPGKVTVKE